eukprot:365720-Chlamydomonas_euryale.AAC.2
MASSLLSRRDWLLTCRGSRGRPATEASCNSSSLAACVCWSIACGSSSLVGSSSVGMWTSVDELALTKRSNSSSFAAVGLALGSVISSAEACGTSLYSGDSSPGGNVPPYSCSNDARCDAVRPTILAICESCSTSVEPANSG